MWSICGLRSGFKMFNIFLAKLNKPNYIFALLVNYKIFGFLMLGLIFCLF